MLDEYKRRQMDFEDHEWCRYNLEPEVLPPAYRFYSERQCAIGVTELNRSALGQLDRVLVCGVGGGADLQYWLEHLQISRCIALDFSIEAIRATQRRLANHKLPDNVEYLKADIEDIPLRDNSVDLVVASQVLHHTLDPRQACREMFRVARHGVLLLEPAWTLLTPLLKRVGLATSTESAGNVVLRFRRSDFISYLDGARYSLRYRRYLFYYHPFIERVLTRFLDFPGGVQVVKGFYRASHLCLFPLRSKCLVLIQKQHSVAV